jgi:hypothetical protein
MGTDRQKARRVAIVMGAILGAMAAVGLELSPYRPALARSKFYVYQIVDAHYGLAGPGGKAQTLTVKNGARRILFEVDFASH